MKAIGKYRLGRVCYDTYRNGDSHVFTRGFVGGKVRTQCGARFPSGIMASKNRPIELFSYGI